MKPGGYPAVRASSMGHSTATVSLIPLVVTVTVVFCIGFPSLYYPFGRDQGIHAYIAQLAGDGYVVYRDVFNVKPPLTTVVHWLSQALFGETMRAIRYMDLLIVTATALMLQMLVVRHLRSVWAACVAAVSFAAFHYSNNYWFTAQTDGWCNLFLVAAMLLYSRTLDTESLRVRTTLLGSAGFVIGLAFWLKYTTAVVLLVPLAAHLAQKLPWRRIVPDGGAVAIGFLGCIAVGLTVLAVQGALPAFLDIQDFMRSYVAHSQPWWHGLASPILVLTGAKAATALAMLGLYATYKAYSRGERIPECVALAAWLAAGWASGVLQGKVILYHLLPLLPPLSIASAVGVHALAGKLRVPGRWGLALPATACAAAIWFSNIPAHYRDVRPVIGGGERALRAYWQNGPFGHGDYQTRDNLALAEYLKARTLSCDSVFIWGFEPGVYFLSGRRMVSRFLYNFPMFTAYYRQSYRDEFMADIAAAPPLVFVVEHEDRTPHVSVHNHDSAEVLEQFTALKAFVDTRYRLRDRVARFDVFFRRDIEPDAARSCPGTR